MHRQHPTDPWPHFRKRLAQADYGLTPEVYAALRDVFLAYATNVLAMQHLRQSVPEYGKPELLLCVNKTGEPASIPAEIGADFRRIAESYSDFETWLGPATLPDGRPVALIARWLCHWAGFRHRTVHLFIDHPTSPDYIFVQVRSLGKAEAPGCFDLPAAGHVVGLESVTETLFKELQGELGLSRDVLTEVKEVSAYEYHAPPPRPGFHNVEHRTVFRARLKPEAAWSVRFVDGEVAALALFSLPELKTLLHQFPDRVASGLAMSLPFYLEQQADLVV